MIRAYIIIDGHLAPLAPGAEDLSAAVWIDLIDPSEEDADRIAALAGLDLPTREDMQEIEMSSRLYSEGGAAFMTATLPAQAEGDDPDMQPVTFVLSPDRLITLRHHDPFAFRALALRAQKGQMTCAGPQPVLLSLLEAVVDREADILERVGRDINAISRGVFRQPGARPTPPADYRRTLEAIGRKGDLVSNIRDSLANLDRLARYLAQMTVADKSDRGIRERVKTLSRDILSIGDHAGVLAQKVTFLLDATLGLIGIEQNAIIKIFSVAAVVFLPPTLIASAYGMNFAVMPELSWPFGYPFAIGLMILSAILPWAYFKRRGWL